MRWLVTEMPLPPVTAAADRMELQTYLAVLAVQGAGVAENCLFHMFPSSIGEQPAFW